MKLWLAGFALAGLATASGDILAGYDFGTPAAGTIDATTVASGVTASTVAGSGGASTFALQQTLGDNTGFAASGTAFGSTEAGNFGGSPDGATGTSLAEAIADEDYVTVTLTADAPGSLNVSGFSIAASIANLTNGRPAEFFNVVAQVNGGSTWDASGALFASDQEIVTAQGLTDWDDFFVDLSGEAAFQSIDSVEFRVYIWGANGSLYANRSNYDQIVVEGSIGASTVPIWQVDGSGNWSVPANWSPSVPNGSGDEARFSDALPLTGPLTATLDVPVTVGQLSMDSAHSITIDGASALTLDGGGAASVSSTTGAHEISADVNLVDPLEVNLSTGTSLDISGALSGSTAVTSVGAGQLTLSGDLSGFSGGLTANAGTLEVAGSGASSDITVNTGVTLSGEGSHSGTLNLAADSILSVDPATAGAFTTGTLSPTAPISVTTTSDATGLGSFAVLNYTTYGGSVDTDFIGLNERLTFSDDLAGSITATAVGAQSITWTATADDNPTFWDIATSKNWSSANEFYYDGDTVTFNDDGVDLVDVQTAVAPAAVIFSNTDGTEYYFNDVTTNVESISAEDGGITVVDDGNVALNVKITGNTDITHSGAGTLTLGGGGVTNDFVGTVTVDGGGTLLNGGTSPNNLTSLGDFGNTFSFTNGSTFDISSGSNVDRGFKGYGTGSFVFGDGTTLTNASTTTKRNAFDDELDFAGDVSIDGEGRLDISGPITVSGTDIVITLNNTVGCVLGGDNSSQSIAEWVVNAGTLIVSNDNALGGSAIVTVNPDGSIRGNVAGDQVRGIPNNITLNGGSIESGYQDSDTYLYGMVEVAANSAIRPNINDTDDREVHLLGGLSGTGDLTLDSGTTVIDSSLDSAGFTGAFVLEKNYDRATVLQLLDGTDLTHDIVVGDVGGNKSIQLPLDTLAGISGNITINDVDAEQFDLDVLGEEDVLTISGAISGTGAAGVTKTSAGSVVLEGINTYTGNTFIYNGTVTLADGGQLTFAPTANGESTQASGWATGTLALDGEIHIDLSGADTTSGNEWLLIDGSVMTASYGATFTVGSSLGSFTETAVDSGVWTLTNGDATWTFSEADGTLSLSGGGTDYDTWAALYAPEDVSDTGADNDNDGLTNQQEYAYGLSPVDGSSVNAYLAEFDADAGTFTYQRRKQALTGLTYTVEISLDLETWSVDGGITQTATEIDANNESVLVTVPGPLPAKAFVRVKAQ